MKLKNSIAAGLSLLLTACASMSDNGPPQHVQVANSSTNAAHCVIVNDADKELANGDIPRGKVGVLTLHTSPAENALICKCADCKGNNNYSAFDQLSGGKPVTLAGNPNRSAGGKLPYILY